jgi:hypothetical protein
MVLSSSVVESHTMQALRAERLQQLTIYVGEPQCFLICRPCRIVLPLSCIPSHFHKNKAHAYNSRDLVDAVEAWKTIYLPDYPIKFLTEDDARKWTRPAPTSAPIVELPIHYAFHCRFIDLATDNQCLRILSSRSRIRAHYISVYLVWAGHSISKNQSLWQLLLSIESAVYVVRGNIEACLCLFEAWKCSIYVFDWSVSMSSSVLDCDRRYD